MKQRFYLLFAVLALAAWGLVTVLKHQAEQGPEIGTIAPAFTLEDIKGESRSLESFRGKVVLLNFWATWCGPCRHEMPSLETLYQKFKGQDFEILGISADEEGWDPVQAFLKIVPVTFPILMDLNLKASEAYGIYRIPESFLVDQRGKIIDRFVGPQDYNHEVFSRKIQRLLQAKSADS